MPTQTIITNNAQPSNSDITQISENQQLKSRFLSLPEEVILTIFQYLSRSDRANLALTCRKAQRIFADRAIDRLTCLADNNLDKFLTLLKASFDGKTPYHAINPFKTKISIVNCDLSSNNVKKLVQFIKNNTEISKKIDRLCISDKFSDEDIQSIFENCSNLKELILEKKINPEFLKPLAIRTLSTLYFVPSNNLLKALTTQSFNLKKFNSVISVTEEQINNPTAPLIKFCENSIVQQNLSLLYLKFKEDLNETSLNKLLDAISKLNLKRLGIDVTMAGHRINLSRLFQNEDGEKTFLSKNLKALHLVGPCTLPDLTILDQLQYLSADPISKTDLENWLKFEIIKKQINNAILKYKTPLLRGMEVISYNDVGNVRATSKAIIEAMRILNLKEVLLNLSTDVLIFASDELAQLFSETSPIEKLTLNLIENILNQATIDKEKMKALLNLLKNLKSLEELTIKSDILEYDYLIPEDWNISQLQALKELTIELETSFSDQFITELKNAPCLETIDFEDTAITSEQVQMLIENQTSLKRLRLPKKLSNIVFDTEIAITYGDDFSEENLDNDEV